MAEIYHNTDEQARDYLSRALALVEELDPPEDLRVPFFVKAVDLTAAKTIMQPQPQSLALPQLGLPPNQRG